MADLAGTGMTAEQIALVMELSAAVSAEARPIVDEAAQRRRERDRTYQAERRQNRQISADSDDVGDTPSLSRPPNEINSNPPTHTHPDVNTTRARTDPFPRPEWADPQHWTDLKANRKAKRLPNTPSAYAKFLRDIEKWTDAEWPPGRLLEAIAARGWASAEHDPRGTRSHGLPARRTDLLPSSGTRGNRPNPCLDMLYAAEAEIRAGEDPQPDFGARPALRAIGSG